MVGRIEMDLFFFYRKKNIQVLLILMNQEDAKKYIHRLGVLLCLDVPDGTEFGIDYHFWEVGPKFKGVKLIPLGIHYVFYWYLYLIAYLYKSYCHYLVLKINMVVILHQEQVFSLI